MKLKVNNKVYWGIKISLFVIGGIALYKIVLYFSKLLDVLVKLLNTIDITVSSPEFKFILILASLWVCAYIFEVVVLLVSKLNSLLEKK